MNQYLILKERNKGRANVAHLCRPGESFAVCQRVIAAGDKWQLTDDPPEYMKCDTCERMAAGIRKMK